MRNASFSGRRFAAATIAIVGLILTALPAAASGADSPSERGRGLFVKRWKELDEMCTTGDGLGPVYNARSCAECHGMVRPGGAGRNDHNVDLLTVSPQNIPKYERAAFARRIAAIDPILENGGNSIRRSITLHKFGNDTEYGDWRLGLVKLIGQFDAGSPPVRSAKQLLAEGKKKNAALAKDARRSDLRQLAIFQRSTPALFGAGLIEKIPQNVINDMAKSQAAMHTGIKGQVAIASDGRVGKFGWRGHTATLSDFVLAACANELGLNVPGHPQGLDPLDPSYHAKGDDLTQAQGNDLTAFVANLPRPEQRRPINLAERKQWDAGEQVFNSVGCANCHVRKMDSVDGLYSDLLLHDMGQELADPAGANPPAAGGAVAGCYSPPVDIFATVPPITKRQWRTAPLWGVADSGPYLHDGRAATLNEAIRLHDGEAAATVRLYVMLPSAERQKLLAFLNSLAAPNEEDLVASK